MDKPHDPSWTAVRRVADEVKLKVHLAGMEARARWAKLQPKVEELEKQFEAGAQKAEHAISEQVSTVAAGLRQLLTEIADDVRKHTTKSG